MRKTKLLITMGPALLEGDRLREALKIADAVRLNASHGDPILRLEMLQRVRAVSEELERRIPIVLDLQGPKWRVGALEAPVELVPGRIGGFFPAGDEPPAGLDWAAPLPHPELFLGAKPGQTWVLDDGAINLEVVEAAPRLIRARVRVGGFLKSRKGLQPIGLDVAFDPVTPKDVEDLRWGVEQGVDLFAQSFVRRASDVRDLKARIEALGGYPAVIAKIEHPQALENLEAILEEAWGVMVARGDLGVELGVEHVPSLQKRIIATARRALKPVITATQMLESMIENAQPTRAEASDVANAIWDGTDAVMLSAESAVGAHPVEAIQWLARIAEDADDHTQPRRGRFADFLPEHLEGRQEVAVAFAACYTAEAIKARWIVVFTEGGGSARMVSRLAAGTPILGATTDPANARRIGLMRGVSSLLVPHTEHLSQMVPSVERLLKSDFGLQRGDRVVLTLGHPLWKTGTTNTMRVLTY